MKTRVLFVFLICCMLGCATANISVSDIESVKNSNRFGLLLISNGRSGSTNWFKNLPFVEYKIFAVAGPESYIPVGVLPHEVIVSPLGPGKYGVINLLRLPAGEYLLVGYRPGSIGAYIPLAYGGMFMGGATEMPLNLWFELTIVPGKLNYGGELLTMNEHFSAKNSVVITNQFERDIKYPRNTEILRSFDVVEVYPRRLEYTLENYNYVKLIVSPPERK